jgi:MGT family glycosyltransferase
MRHYGGIANAGLSHVQTICTLGRILKDRGHRFTLFGTASQASQAERHGVRSVILGSEDPAREIFERIDMEQSLSMSAYLDYMKRMAAFICRDAPDALRREHVDFLLADQEEPAAATAADLSGIPYVTICGSVPLNADPWVPPSFVPWQGSSRLWARTRNLFAYRIRNLAVSGLNRTLNRYRKAGQLPLYRRPDDSFSTLAHISQLVQEIDFVHEREDPRLHYVGPFQRRSRSDIPFPYERLNGRPLIYVSFGTLKSDITAQFQLIATACAGLDVQLVMTLGGGHLTAAHAQFPGSPIVVSFAPQVDLLRRAAIFVTHAGVNSVMEAMSLGVPLIACPQYGDQFGMGARIAHHRLGRVLHARSFQPAAIRDAIDGVLHDPGYRAAAERVQQAIAQTRGADQAVDISESLAADVRIDARRTGASGGR